MTSTRAVALSLAALAAAGVLAGVVLVDSSARPPSLPPSQPQSGTDAPVDPSDPDALLVQVEPSRDGRWLAFGLDLERVAGAQSLYLTSLVTGDRRYLCEGVLAPVPWDRDGRLVFVDRSTDAPLACWMDVASAQLVRTASPRELSGLVDSSLDGPRWAQRTQSRRPDGGFHERIEWRGKGGVLELQTQSLFDVEISAVDGVVFELRREVALRSLLRHDLRKGQPSTLCESKDLALFRLSPDGAKLLVSERGDGRVSFVARSALDGRELCEPWTGERVSANWLARRDSRYVLLSRGDSSELIDLESGETTPLGDNPPASLDVRVLDAEHILRRTEHAVDVLDRTGALTRSVFPPAR